METIVQTIALLSILLLNTVAPALAGERDGIVVDAPVSEVMVYDNGARVTRRSTVELPEGLSILKVELFDLPGGDRIGEDDLKLITTGIDGRSRILSTRLVEEVRKPQPARLQAIETSLSMIRTELAGSLRLMRNAQADIELIEGWGRQLLEELKPAEAGGVIDLGQLETRFEFISRKRMEILEVQEEAQTANRELLEQAEELEGRLATERAGQPVVVAEIEVESPGGTCELRITWLEFLSDWDPELTVHVDTTTGRTTVEMHAEIANRTNTDWNGISLGLTTASIGGETPSSVRPMTVRIVDADEDEPAEAIGAREQSPPTADRLLYTLEQPATLKQGRGKLLVGRYETTSKLDLIARPLVEPSAWQRASVRNLSGFTFLPGPISLHVDGAFKSMPILGGMIPPQETFDLWIQRIEDVGIERSILEQETIKTGLLGGGRLSRTRFQIALRNLGTTTREILIEDRMAWTESEDIEVSLRNVTPPLHEDERALGLREESGILQWLVQLPPRSGAEDPPVIVDWTVNVSHSADVDTTRIPD